MYDIKPLPRLNKVMVEMEVVNGITLMNRPKKNPSIIDLRPKGFIDRMVCDYRSRNLKFSIKPKMIK